MDLEEYIEKKKKQFFGSTPVDTPDLDFRESLKKKALIAGAIGVGVIGLSGVANASGLVFRSRGVNYPVEGFLNVAPTIANNQIAYGIGPSAISGNANFTWDYTNKYLTITGGTAQSTISKGLVVNSGLGNAAADSFNVKSVGDQYLIYTDALNNRVGIGTNAPTRKLDILDDGIRIRTAKTPASATAAGTQGDICWDANYVYICVATNSWKRVAISTW
ncbi:MAG: hypothetical protein WCW44_04890 [archaeon]|jgi:hypothetical protein